jgi:hypothetical protein|tara:strand:- start:113 stop:295 length:183 start_codon:yes stop_codon:yes gene_type:complete
MSLTKKTALSIFKEEVNTPQNANLKGDKVALCEAWNNFTDMLCKDDLITDAQYNNWANPF